MKRTVIRYSNTINQGKWHQLCQVAKLYRDEKNTHLKYFNHDANYATDKNEKVLRDELVSQEYQPETKLQARQWKTALKAAYETVDKNWCALAVEIRSMIFQHKQTWSDAEMHYGYWLVYSGKRMAQLVSNKAPVPEEFQVTFQGQKRVRNYLRRVIRRKRGERPVANLSRSFEVDADMYSVEENGKDSKKQYIKIMGLTPGKRIIVPLTGHSYFSGTIKIILDFSKKRIEVHTTNDLPEIEALTDEPIALDAGVSEVFTDGLGLTYEPTFGKTITRASKQMNKTSKGRNKAHALKKKSSQYKAQRIRKFNLGKKKLNKRKRKAQIRIRQQISQAIHQVVNQKQPQIIITERLDIRGKAKSKGMSRLVSYWMRGSLKERLDFLALAEGFCHKQVNPAYTSQMCPTCLYVHKDNRTGDIFHCLNCGHTDLTDRVAAINLRARYYDSEITIYTPKSVVKSNLLRRFTASLEKKLIPQKLSDELTVSGRTDTYPLAVSERNAVA